jgi:hypothetical protein
MKSYRINRPILIQSPIPIDFCLLDVFIKFKNDVINFINIFKGKK